MIYKEIGKPTREIRINLNNTHFKFKSIKQVMQNLETQDRKFNIQNNKSYGFYFL